MNAANSQRLVQHIRRLAGDPQTATSDGELLRRYRESGDQAAFAALIRQHGPMVFAVCQSVLRQRHDAEDAFQAAFLILARKAGSIRRQEGLGGWLQRVAYRVALKARADTIRRQQREAKTARSAVAEPAGDELSWGELRAILHAELAALPESLRAPLVLCYLEGLTQEEAAHRLGWTAATVKGRLQRGREKLRRRLERRGIALTAALGAVLTGQALADTAVRMSGPLTMETATTTAAALARAFLRPILSMKLAMLSALLLSIGVVAGIALRSPQPESEAPPAAAEQRPEPRPAVDAHGDPLPDGAVARLGTVRFNHGDGLNALYFTPDGKTILSQGNGGIRFWDADNGKERDRIRTPKTSFQDQTVLLANGKILISLNEGWPGDVVRRWDLEQKKEIRTLTLPVRRTTSSAYHQNALSPDGKLAVLHVHTPAQVQVFDLTTGKNLYQLAKGGKEFLAVAFAGNDRIVSADQKQHLEVWEARTGKRLRPFTHDAPIRFLLASPDGRWLASLEQRPSPFGRQIEQQEVVHLWDVDSGAIKHSLRAKAKHWFTNICFAPDGKNLLTSSRSPSDRDEVVLWDRETGRRLVTFDGAAGINADVAAISPDGSRLAAGNQAGKFELWDLKTGHRLTPEDSRHTRDGAAFFSLAGDRVFTVGSSSISSWDATTGRRLRFFDLPRNTLYNRGHSADGRYAVTFQLEGEEFRILVWDIAAGKRLHTLRFPGGYQQISSTFSPDSMLLATRHPGKQTLVHLWDVRSGKEVRSFAEKKAGWPGRMEFTADGKTLFVAGKHVVGYEVASGKELFSWRLKPLPNTSGVRTTSVGGAPESEDDRLGWSTLAVSPEGTRIAATPWPGNVARGSAEDAIAWHDARTGKLLHRSKDSSITNYLLKQLAFSSDGQLLASSNSEIVQLWEVATGKLIQTFKGHQGNIQALAFSRDGRLLASASSDSTVLIWDLTGQRKTVAPLTEAKRKECWNDLAGEDACRAHQAVWSLAQEPGASVPFLKARLHPVKVVSREQLNRLIQDLDADAFDARQRAVAELEKLGELAEPALRRTLANKPTLEQRRRIEPILARVEAALPSGESLRSLRAVRVLEQAATAEARQLLRELARGAEGAALTRAALAALAR